MDSARGKLLIAGPLLLDPNFWRTVVLVIEHTTEGALGLVLNRPSQMDVSDPLPQWEHLAAQPAVLFLGGPVQHQAVICLRALVEVASWVHQGKDGAHAGHPWLINGRVFARRLARLTGVPVRAR